MPSLEILLNDKLLTLVDVTELDVLTFGMISTSQSKYFYMQLNSMDKKSDTHTSYFNKQLSFDDVVAVTLKRNNTKFRSSIPKDIEDRRDASKTIFKRDKPVGLLVESAKNEKNKFKAYVTDDSTLHLSVTWIKKLNSCLMEVLSTKYIQDNQNETSIEYPLSYEETIKISLIQG